MQLCKWGVCECVVLASVWVYMWFFCVFQLHLVGVCVCDGGGGFEQLNQYGQCLVAVFIRISSCSHTQIRIYLSSVFLYIYICLCRVVLSRSSAYHIKIYATLLAITTTTNRPKLQFKVETNQYQALDQLSVENSCAIPTGWLLSTMLLLKLFGFRVNIGGRLTIWISLRNSWPSVLPISCRGNALR